MHFTRLSSAIALAFMALPNIASATCCHTTECLYEIPASPDKPNREQICVRYGCADGKNIPFGECCGYRRCNIFCCNCDKTADGKICRVKSNQALAKQRLLGNEIERDPEEVAAGDLEMFREANTDGSGKLCINQFLAYMGAGRNDLQAKLKFHQYDRNGDGFLTPDEMRLSEVQ